MTTVQNAQPGSAAAAAFTSRAQAATLDHAERAAGLGTWEYAPENALLVCSANLLRLFGLEPDEATPTPESLLARVHADDRQRIEEAAREMATGGRRGDQYEFRIVRPDGSQRVLRAVVAGITTAVSGGPRLFGSVQDVTRQRGLDRQLAAHIAVSEALDDWTSFEPGATDLLRRLGAALDLAFAALWIPEGSALCARVIWHQPSPALASVADATRRWRPGFGSATIGRAFTGQQPALAANAAEGGPRDRNRAIRDAGIRGALAVPAVFVSETLAVLEFLSFDPSERFEPMDRLARALNGVGHEIGHFLSHRRGELAAPVLTRRQLQILELAGQGRSAGAIAAELNLSPATVKRHFERAYRRLGVSDRASAVGEAMRRGLIH